MSGRDCQGGFQPMIAPILVQAIPWQGTNGLWDAKVPSQRHLDLPLREFTQHKS